MSQFLEIEGRAGGVGGGNRCNQGKERAARGRWRKLIIVMK